MLQDLANNLLGLAEIGGNKFLAMDEQALQHCRDLQGKIVAIELSDLNVSLYCHPGDWGIRLTIEAPAREPDASIRGRLMGLVSLSLNQDKLTTSIQERVEITGNAAVAQKFQKLLTEIDIDWEQQLSLYTGDIVAYRINQGLNKTRDFVRDSIESLALSSREYLQYEQRSLPAKVEFERFRQQVSDTRDAVDRLDALLNHYLAKQSDQTRA